MRCSSCEAHFEPLLDGTLSARVRREVLAHVRDCATCSSVLEELRVVDALLLTPRTLEPAANFTFSTMAEIRSMPVPTVRRTGGVTFVGSYLAGAWIVIALWLIASGPAARAALGIALDYVWHLGSSIDSFARIVWHGAGFGYANITAVVASFLVLDLAVASIAVYAHRSLRPRLAAHLRAREVA